MKAFLPDMDATTSLSHPGRTEIVRNWTEGGACEKSCKISWRTKLLLTAVSSLRISLHSIKYDNELKDKFLKQLSQTCAI